MDAWVALSSTIMCAKEDLDEFDGESPSVAEMSGDDSSVAITFEKLFINYIFKKLVDSIEVHHLEKTTDIMTALEPEFLQTPEGSSSVLVASCVNVASVLRATKHLLTPNDSEFKDDYDTLEAAEAGKNKE